MIDMTKVRLFSDQLRDLKLTQICSHNKPNHDMTIKLSQLKIAQLRSKNKRTLHTLSIYPSGTFNKGSHATFLCKLQKLVDNPLHLSKIKAGIVPILIPILSG